MPRENAASELMPGIWRVRERGATSYIVKLSPGAVLIDTGPDASGRGIMAGFQACRVGLSSVRAILLTSLEPEAIGGLRALAKRSAAPAFGARDDGSEPLRVVRPGDVLAEHFLAVGIPGAAGAMAYYFRPARALFSGNARTLELPPGLDVERVLSRAPSRTD